MCTVRFPIIVRLIAKTFSTIVLIVVTGTLALGQQTEVCRLTFDSGLKTVQYTDGTFKYIQGSQPISQGGVISPVKKGTCGAQGDGKIRLKADGTWKFLPDPDLSKIEAKSFDEVTSDRISIVDKVIRVAGTLKERDWYWGLYSDKEATHFGFRLTSPSSNRNMTLYFPRGEKANELRAKMKERGGKLDGEFDIWFSTSAYEAVKTQAGEIYGELLDYHPAEAPQPSEVKKADVAPTEKPTVPRKSGFIYQDMIDDDSHKDWSSVGTFSGMQFHAWVYNTRQPNVGILLQGFAPQWVEMFVRMTKLENGTRSYSLGNWNCREKTMMLELVGIKYGDTKRFVLRRNSDMGVPSGTLRVSKKDVPEYNLLQWACTKAGFWK